VRRAAPLTLLLLAGLVLAGCSSSRPYDHSTAKPLPSTVVGTVPKAAAQPTFVVPAALKGGDPVAGKKFFQTGPCASCHTLADAGTHGTIGPNLTGLKVPLSLVADRLLNGKGAMPSFKGTYTDQQLANVAAYVVKATGGNPNG
jgi:mono/diheme cytochrome c family protein